MQTRKRREIIRSAKKFMEKHNLDAWVLYDFKGSNPIFWRVVGSKLPTTRRSFIFVPKVGSAKVLANTLDKELFAYLGWPIIDYSSREEMETEIENLLKDLSVIAMEYSSRANIPYVERVDAGTIELFLEKGVKVVSSGDIFQYSAAKWTKDELNAHLQATRKISMIKDEAFEFARKKVMSHQSVTEFDVQEFIMHRFAHEGMVSEDRPIVAVGENTANPHYKPSKNSCEKIERESLLILDLWAKNAQAYGVFADITWMAYFGKEVSEQYSKVFGIVAEARDKVFFFLRKKLEDCEPCIGWELDKVARDFISTKGYGDRFIHRTGHSIGALVHGDSVNLDNYESKDTRRIISGVGFSVEPGIYLEKWGVRSEINVYVNETEPVITTPVQKSIVTLY